MDADWSLYFEGLQLRWSFSFSPLDLKTFSNLSGDYNPIHTDLHFAKSKGFDAPLIYGLLLSSQMSSLIGQELPDHHCILTSINVDFIAPGFAGEKLDFIAQLVMKSDATHALDFTCTITRASKILCRSKVSAIWRP